MNIKSLRLSTLVIQGIRAGIVVCLTISTIKTASAQPPSIDRIDKLNQELQQAVEAQETDKAKKITELLIRELVKYRRHLVNNSDRSLSNLNIENISKKPKIPNTNNRRPQFGRELIIETSAAYRNDAEVCVLGQIHNSSRSPIDNSVEAIAYFFDDRDRYLGSQTKLINPQGILPNQTVNFIIQTSQAKQIIASIVRLRFRGSNAEGNFYLYPTFKGEKILSISNGDRECK